MRIVICGESFEGTPKELCDLFGCNRPQDLPQAINLYKLNAQTLLANANNAVVCKPKTKSSPQTFNG